MKRLFSIWMFVLMFIFICSSVLAARLDTTTLHPLDESIRYPDLQTEARDDYGRVVVDTITRKQLYYYHYSINEVLKATAIDLIEGYSDGTFRPESNITRGEFLKLAIELSTNRNFDYGIIPTTVDHWAAKYLAVAEMQDVVEPGTYTKEDLDEPITRIEMICILSKIQINMKGVSQYRDAKLPNYTDIDSLTEEEKELLLHAARYELLEGMFETDTIRPNDNLTRGDAAIAIMRIY